MRNSPITLAGRRNSSGTRASVRLSRAEQSALGRLDPFELKNMLVGLAEKHARHDARLLLNAGRGNPDWLATAPREALLILGAFALRESGLGKSAREPGAMLRKAGMARRLRTHLEALPESPGTRLLRGMLRYAVRELGFEPDAFAYELADGASGDHYPEPVRMLPHAERIVHAYLAQELCAGALPGRFDLFAVEGASAGICYVFDSLLQNGLLHRRDRIALAVPIFSPYVELPHLDRYKFEVVYIHASERHKDGTHSWQYPDSEIDKLADPAIKALFLVNPSNPPSVAMRARTVARLVKLVKAQRRDLIIISDDVYAPFVEGFRSLLAALPHNTIGLYSFSKFFGSTGWRLGVVAMHRNHVVDRLIAGLPGGTRRAIERNYRNLALAPGEIKFMDRMVADSRRVALNHTAGLSTPQQIQMLLFAAFALLDRAGRYKRSVKTTLRRRHAALFAGLGAPLREDSLRAGYYSELDLMSWAVNAHGPEFGAYLEKEHSPVELLVRLAKRSSIVLLPCGGFAGPPWSVRVSLANLPEASCREIGLQIAMATREYVREWESR